MIDDIGAAKRSLPTSFEENEQLYRQLMVDLPAAVYVCDNEGYVRFYNEAAVAIWGNRPKIGITKWCGSWKIYRADGSAMILGDCPMAVAIKEGRSIVGEEVIVERPDGIRLNVLPHPRPIMNSSGVVVGAINMLLDITASRCVERELHESKARVLSTSETLEIATAELNLANDTVAFQNDEREKRAAELIIANEELVFQSEEKGTRALELIVANRELVFQNEEKGKRAAELIVANGELSFASEEKGKRAAELVIANEELVFQNEEKGKRAAELVVANTELTFQNTEKEKRAEELVVANKELESVNKDLESFSYSVSHDLHAPLRKISLFATLLEKSYLADLDHRGVTAIHSIIRNAKKMSTLIDDLLTFSKLGRKEITLSEINMTALAKSIVDEILVEDNESNVKITIQKLPHVKGDRSLLKQVWVNLISNAVKYSARALNPSVEIGGYEENNNVVYTIKDNGVGFDMNYYHKLFGVFERLHSPTEFEGTGIGLAIVQKIIQRHNGTIWAESKVNVGTTFYFSFPA